MANGVPAAVVAVALFGSLALAPQEPDTPGRKHLIRPQDLPRPFATAAADNQPEIADLTASMAKAYASDAGTRVTGASLQVHGGIGFTWEHDLHLWLKRASADAVMFGDARWHRERVAQMVIDRPGATAQPSPALAAAK